MNLNNILLEANDLKDNIYRVVSREEILSNSSDEQIIQTKIESG